MNIKNYTSTVPVGNSIARIEHNLVQVGATNISKSYVNQRPTGMIFQIIENGSPRTFSMPARSEEIFKFLVKQQSKPPKKEKLINLQLQAERTAWKSLSELIEIQVSQVLIGQRKLMELMLAHVCNGQGETFYDLLEANNFTAMQLKA